MCQIRSMLLLAFCCQLLLAPSITSLPISLPRTGSTGRDDATITNRVESSETTRNAVDSHSSRGSNEPINPTSLPTNCSTDSNSSSRDMESAASNNQSVRLHSIREYMLARLNITETPPELPGPGDIPAAVLASYNAKLQAQALADKEPKDCPEQKTTQYARIINLYHPSQYASFSATSYTNDKDKSKHEKSDNKKDEKNVPVLYNLTFSNLELASSSLLWSVKLRLFKKKVSTEGRGVNPTESVKIFQAEKRATDKFETLIATKILQSEEDEYVSFDITDGIKMARNTSTNSQTLKLSVYVDTPWRLSPRSKLPPAIAFDVPTYGKSEGAPQRPQLVVETLHKEELLVQKNPLRRRRKRQAVSGAASSEYCFNNPGEGNCCIRRLTVNIQKDLGLSNIISPTSFQPNYCSGSCSNSLWSSANLATKYLQDIRWNNPTAAPEPCCVPHTYKPLSVLMREGSRYKVRDIPNMIVTSCICR